MPKSSRTSRLATKMPPSNGYCTVVRNRFRAGIATEPGVRHVTPKSSAASEVLSNWTSPGPTTSQVNDATGSNDCTSIRSASTSRPNGFSADTSPVKRPSPGTRNTAVGPLPPCIRSAPSSSQFHVTGLFSKTASRLMRSASWVTMTSVISAASPAGTRPTDSGVSTC